MMENWDGETTCGRSVVAGNRGVAPGTEAAATEISGAQTDRRSACADGNRVRVEDRHCVGRSAAGAGLWQRHVVLAKDAGVAGGRSVGPTANPADRTPGPRGKN